MIRLIKRIIDKANNLNSLKGKIVMGKNVIIRSTKTNGKVSIGSNSKVVNANLAGEIIINEHCKLLNAEVSGNVTFGSYTSIAGQGTTISSQFNPVSIGSFCSIASNCTILEFNHPISRLSTYYINKHLFKAHSAKDDRESKGPIEIGNDVWIGANVVILSGVKIGNGAIIGSNSVITKDIPSYAIVGGVPAKIIKYRFDEDLISLLNEIAWWNWPIEKIIENRDIFSKKEIEADDLSQFVK